MRNSNLGIGVLHVKVKYWRIFGDIIYLLAQVFIASSNIIEIFLWLSFCDMTVPSKNNLSAAAVYVQALPGCHTVYLSHEQYWWHLNHCPSSTHYVWWERHKIATPSNRLKHWELSVDTSGPHKGIHRWCGLQCQIISEWTPAAHLLTWKLIHKRYLKWLKIYSLWSEVNSCLISTITRNMTYF